MIIVAHNIGPTLTWTMTGTLPSGLTFHGGVTVNGQVVIDGTPTSIGSYSITVTATDSFGNSISGIYPLNTIGITTTSLPDWSVGVPYYVLLQASGGSGIYSWEIVSGTLPDGLILNAVGGFISGTPTGSGDGTSPIAIKVFDIDCEKADPQQPTPQAALVTSSVTTLATLHGYDEFIPSVPPKKYHSITFSGTSLRVGFTPGGFDYKHSMTRPIEQCAGAKYVYSGTGTIDATGNQTASYTKTFLAQCGNANWPFEPLQTNPNAIHSETGFSPKFVGYCWSEDGVSCPACDPIEANWVSLGNVATNTPAFDLRAFLATSGSPTVTATSWSINDVLNGLTQIDDSRDFPQFLLDGIIAAYINWTDTNNYSAVLSDEYTDAEAIANAIVINGNSRTAENLPRTTGFSSKWTTVNWGLNCSNLIVGATYQTTVELLDSDGTNTTVTDTFVAAAETMINVVNHNITQPAAGHTTTVFNPTISIV
jgi:hypothetical protein